jgi:hypothetical protein
MYLCNNCKIVFVEKLRDCPLCNTDIKNTKNINGTITNINFNVNDNLLNKLLDFSKLDKKIEDFNTDCSNGINNKNQYRLFTDIKHINLIYNRYAYRYVQYEPRRSNYQYYINEDNTEIHERKIHLFILDNQDMLRNLSLSEINVLTDNVSYNSMHYVLVTIKNKDYLMPMKLNAILQYIRNNNITFSVQCNKSKLWMLDILDDTIIDNTVSTLIDNYNNIMRTTND